MKKLMKTLSVALLAAVIAFGVLVSPLGTVKGSAEASVSPGWTQVETGTTEYKIEGTTLTIRPLGNAASGVLPSNTGLDYGDLYFYPWSYNDAITEVVIQAGVSTGEIASMLFYRLENLTEISFPSGFIGPDTTSIAGMFALCSSLTTVDLSNFDTSKVENFAMLFAGCSSLSELDLTGFDTGKVTIMSSIFGECSELKELDLSNFDTGNVEDMWCAFYGCTKLKTIIVSPGKWKTGQVTCDVDMFTGCSALTGEKGTAYDSGQVGKTYARIDKGAGAPGYLTEAQYEISMGTASNTNGTTETDQSTGKAKTGTTVTVTTAPAPHYFLYDFSVADSKGNTVSVTPAGDGEYTFVMPEAGVTVSADYKAIYTVSFDTNGGTPKFGTQIDPQYVKHGDCLAKPWDPTKEGCTFEGWFFFETGSQAGVEWDFSDKVYGDGVLKAQWTEIIEGRDQTIDMTQVDSATFKSNAAFSTFQKVLVDDKEVDAKYYDKAEGSTIITLKKDFLETLSNGKHTISIVSTAGTASCSFTITGNVPNTGDEGVGLWIALTVFAAFGAVVVLRKREVE